jgi:hypothetical protein
MFVARRAKQLKKTEFGSSWSVAFYHYILFGHTFAGSEMYE